MIADYSFPTFVRRFTDGSIADDVTWTAYDIESTVTDGRAKGALKLLRYRGSYPLCLSKFAADYRIPIPQVKQMLALWFTWHRLANGTITRCKLRSTGND